MCIRSNCWLGDGRASLVYSTGSHAGHIYLHWALSLGTYCVNEVPTNVSILAGGWEGLDGDR